MMQNYKQQELYEIFVIEGEGGAFQSYIGKSICDDNPEFEKKWNAAAQAIDDLNEHINKQIEDGTLEELDY